MPIYTRADLEARVNAAIKNKIGLLTNRAETMNDAVRAVNAETDLRSTRRKANCFAGVFDEQLAYPAPVDIKAQKLVSLSKLSQGNDVYVGFNLIPYEQFNQKLGNYNRYSDGRSSPEIRFGNEREMYTVAFDDLSMVRRMLLAAPQNGTSQVLSSLDSLTAGGGLWTSFGDAFNVDTNVSNFVRGNGSIGYDIDGAGGTTAGIYNSTLTPFSLAEFLNKEYSIFAFSFFSDVTNVTNITLRIGNDASNYLELAVTATHFNTVFAKGWNTLRFDMQNATTVGTVDASDLSYIALFMTKTAAKINETNFAFDHVIASSGEPYCIRYYSKYPWQNQAGVWMEQSTQSDDFLNADSDEYDLIIEKAIYYAAGEVEETAAQTASQVNYDRKLAMYTRGNPSESLIETSDYQAQYYI